MNTDADNRQSTARLGVARLAKSRQGRTSGEAWVNHQQYERIRVYPCLSVVIFLFFIAVAHLSGTNTPPARTNAAFSCIMHVHTRMSSGKYQLPELTRIARDQGVDVIFLSDNLVESIEFGFLPLRHIFWAGYQEKPSILTIGWKRCLAEVQRENERLSRASHGQSRATRDKSSATMRNAWQARDKPDVLYIPGVEVVPRFFWSGSLLKTNLVCHNHQRNLVILGTQNTRSLVNLPITCGYMPGRDTLWIIITRVLLVLFISACLGFLFLPRRMARRSGYSAGMIRRAFLFGLILPLVLLMIVVNLTASWMPAFDIYSPDNPERFEQRVLDALKREKLISFWAHPEAPDHQEFKYFGVSFAVDTRPYPEVLLKTKGYTGFAGVNQGANKFVNPGSIWDVVLKQYLDGKRDEPPWCFGEMLYHYEGQSGKSLSNVETMVWAPEKKAAALLDSIRKGLFYARWNYAGQSFTLDQWQVNGFESGQTGRTTNSSVNISLRVSAKIPGEKAEVLIIRNGEVIKKADMILPLELNLQDSLPRAARGPSEPRVYYRAVVSGKYPVRLVTNPIFIR
ncbi:hypothetical protein ACFLQL_04265 [Verrucomicrobiota bacterium]